MKVFNKFCLALGMFLAIGLHSGCAGGSRGTGAIEIRGLVLTTNGAVLPGVKVSVSQTGDFGISDELGEFIFSTSTSYSAFSLEVETASFSDSIELSDLPPSYSALAIEIEVDEESRTVSPRKIEVDDESDKPDSENGSEAGDSDQENDDQDDPSLGKPVATASATPVGPVATPSDPATPSPNPTSIPTITPTANSHEDHDDEHEHPSDHEDGEDAEAEGSISALSSASMKVESITFVLSSETVYLDEHEQHTTLAEFSVGAQVHVQGTWQNGVAYAERVEKKD